jgi:hypothetical protein
MIYALYCGSAYLDPNVEILGVESFTQCIAACDSYNIRSFVLGAPCQGVTFYENTTGNNCFLKNSTNDPQAMDGVDSAVLLTPQQPAGNSSTLLPSLSTTMGSMYPSGGGGSTVTVTPTVIIGSSTGPGTGAGSVTGTGETKWGLNWLQNILC